MAILKGADNIAEYAGIGRNTLLEWVKTRNFPAKKMVDKRNSPYYSHPDLIDDWLKTQIVQNPVNTQK